MAPRLSARPSGPEAFSVCRAEPQKRAGSWAELVWTEGGHILPAWTTRDSGSSEHREGPGGEGMGIPVQTRPKGSGQRRRSQLVGWLAGVAHETLRGCRRDGTRRGSERAVSRGDQEVRKRSEGIGVVRAGGQGTHLVPCWVFSLVSDPKHAAPSLACPPQVSP